MEYKLLQARSLESLMDLINEAVQVDGVSLEGDIVPIITPVRYYRETTTNWIDVAKIEKVFIQKIVIRK